MAKGKDQLIAALAPVLMAGEEVLDVTTGMVQVERMGQKTERNGTLALTDRRVILFTKKLGGYDSQDFAYGLLTSVDHKRGMMYGNLDLAASGDRAHIKMVPKDEVEQISHLIRERMAAAHTHGATSPANDPLANQIRDLAKLRDEGLISAEEFEAKKRQLLGL
jgi:hypothetical protein